MGAGEVLSDPEGQVARLDGEAVGKVGQATDQLLPHAFDGVGEWRYGIEANRARFVELPETIRVLGAKGAPPFGNGLADECFVGHSGILLGLGGGIDAPSRRPMRAPERVASQPAAQDLRCRLRERRLLKPRRCDPMVKRETGCPSPERRSRLRDSGGLSGRLLAEKPKRGDGGDRVSEAIVRPRGLGTRRSARQVRTPKPRTGQADVVMQGRPQCLV